MNIIKQQEKDSINIVILCGSTGSIIDALEKEVPYQKINIPKIFKVMKGLKRDLRYLYAILSVITTSNQKTCVIVGGIPEVSHPILKIANPLLKLLNNMIKKVTDQFPNTFFVDSAKTTKLIYDVNGKTIVYIHPGDDQYLELVTKYITETNEILTQHVINASLHEIIENHILENRNNLDMLNNTKVIETKMMEELKPYFDSLGNDEAINKGIETFIERFIKEYPWYYYPTPKEEIIKILEENKEVSTKERTK